MNGGRVRVRFDGGDKLSKQADRSVLTRRRRVSTRSVHCHARIEITLFSDARRSNGETKIKVDSTTFVDDHRDAIVAVSLVEEFRELCTALCTCALFVEAKRADDRALRLEVGLEQAFERGKDRDDGCFAVTCTTTPDQAEVVVDETREWWMCPGRNGLGLDRDDVLMCHEDKWRQSVVGTREGVDKTPLVDTFELDGESSA